MSTIAILNINPLSETIIFFIGIYQKYLSPRKVYRCAYSVVNGGPGCSGAVKDIVKKKGIFKGYPLIRQRFQLCREANDERNRRNKSKVAGCVGDGLEEWIDALSCDVPSCKVPSCDCHLPACDLPACDSCDFSL